MTPDAPPSGFLGWLLASLAQDVGFPTPVGGAGELTAALVRRLRSGGGRLVCDAAVDRVVVAGGRAVGVEVAGTPGAGPTCGARRRRRRRPAPAPGRRRAPAGPRAWPPSPASSAAGRRSRSTGRCGPRSRGATAAVARAGTVHLAESIDELALQAAAVSGARIPDDPFVVLGQMTTADPTRSPAGTESAWAYTHVPFHVRDGGARRPITADEVVRGRRPHRGTGRGARPRLPRADRRPARAVARPTSSSGTPTSSRATTPAAPTSCTNNWSSDRSRASAARRHPIGGLYLASASAHPGGGVHGACGTNAARAALAAHRVRRLVPGRAAG